MPKYLPGGQLAECMRSGIKCLASQLVRDGRNPQLLVLPEWADPSHPQESPYVPNDDEGKAHYPIAPDHGYDVAPVLLATLGAETTPWESTVNITADLGPQSQSYGFIQNTDVSNAAAALFAGDFGTIGGIQGGALTGTSNGRNIVALIVRDSTLVLLGLEGDSTDAFAVPATVTISTAGGTQVLAIGDIADDAVGGDGNYYVYWNTLSVDIGVEFTGPQTVVLGGAVPQPLNVDLAWSRARTIGPRIEAYYVYRAGVDALYALLTTLEVTFGDHPEDAPVHPSTYTDTTVVEGTAYTYRVDAGTQGGRFIDSNMAPLQTPYPKRLLENGSRRLLETGDYRLVNVTVVEQN